MFGSKLTPEEKYMKTALKEANKAYRDNDVPIGCVIVNQEGKVIAKAHNRRNRDGSTLAHAELLAIGQACKKVKDWRLEGCTMYVTLEPCQMCAGAIVQARMDKVVIGCMNQKAGCCGSVINLLQMSQFNHQVEIETGIMQKECSSIISDFFKELREEKQQLKAREADALMSADPGAGAGPAEQKRPAQTSTRSGRIASGADETTPAADDEVPPATDDTARLLQMDDLLRAALEEEEQS